jgi:predicted nucleotidyltransferase
MVNIKVTQPKEVAKIVEDRVEEVRWICRRYGVERLDLFGSAVGEGFDREGSALEFVVSFERREPPGQG